jgi:hypothetical protein
MSGTENDLLTPGTWVSSCEPLKAALPFSCQRVVIFPELQFECLYHSDNFFLAYFLAAASRVLMRLLLSRA